MIGLTCILHTVGFKCLYRANAAARGIGGFAFSDYNCQKMALRTSILVKLDFMQSQGPRYTPDVKSISKLL